jgi:hypothetical protein
MRTITVRVLVTTLLVLIPVLSLVSCRRPNVRAGLSDIEWVIVDCHHPGLKHRWVAKLTPQTDSHLIEELIAAVNTTTYRGETESGDYGFLVFKVKGNGIRGFNFVSWDEGPEIEIRPGYWSAKLYDALERMTKQQSGWRTDDSLPDMSVMGIKVWHYGDLVTVFRPDSPCFAVLASAAMEVFKSVDPRMCVMGGTQVDPRLRVEHQGSPQFLFFLEKPVDLYNLTAWHPEDQSVYRVRYKTFRSSVAAVWQVTVSGGIAARFIAFKPDGEKDTWYGWNVGEAGRAFKEMGRPNPSDSFDRIFQVYKQIERPGRAP